MTTQSKFREQAIASLTETSPFEFRLVFTNCDFLQTIKNDRKALNDFALENGIGQLKNSFGEIIGGRTTNFKTFKKALLRICINYDLL